MQLDFTFTIVAKWS